MLPLLPNTVAWLWPTVFACSADVGFMQVHGTPQTALVTKEPGGGVFHGSKTCCEYTYCSWEELNYFPFNRSLVSCCGSFQLAFLFLLVFGVPAGGSRGCITTDSVIP